MGATGWDGIDANLSSKEGECIALLYSTLQQGQIAHFYVHSTAC